jgi:hypothetical protein
MGFGMSTVVQFLQKEVTKPTALPLTTDQKVSLEMEELQLSSTVEPDEEVDEFLVSCTHLKEEYLLLLERVNRLEVENFNLRKTAQFYRDLCIDDCT